MHTRVMLIMALPGLVLVATVLVRVQHALQSVTILPVLMLGEIAGASVLGFVPSPYPAGIILAERWNHETSKIERFTATVEDIERADEFHDVEPSGADKWALIERATRDK